MGFTVEELNITKYKKKKRKKKRQTAKIKEYKNHLIMLFLKMPISTAKQ